MPDALIDPDDAWDATGTAWASAVPRLDGVLDPRATRHSYAVMQGLTSTGGGMVAAVTTSLPERARAGRNYDYRYVWIRDQCFAGQAVATVGPHPLLDSAVAFVAERLLDHGDKLAPASTTAATPVPDERHLDLPGYPGGYDIIGNWVNQLDAFGEARLLFAAAADHDHLDLHHWDAAHVAAAAIGRRWQEPDAGIWEIDNRPWTHSRLTAAATSVHGSGRWQRSPDDEALDAALLIPGLRGAVPSDDPRTVTTLSEYGRELTGDGYAYRFRHDDRQLAEAEGSFLLCGFLVALALHALHIEAAARLSQ